MAEITLPELLGRIARDTRQWGEPFESRKTTLRHITDEPRLAICPKCEGERGYITIIGLYAGCDRCGGRGVVRKRWWHFSVPLPLSFYEEDTAKEVASDALEGMLGLAGPQSYEEFSRACDRQDGRI